MKSLFVLASFFALLSCTHKVPQVERGPSSMRELLISIDLSSKELRVVEGGQTIGEFKIHLKDPLYKNPQCITRPMPGKYPVVKKDLIYKSEKYGVLAHYAIAYRSQGQAHLIKEDDGSKIVRGGHCGIMLNEGQGSLLFALLDQSGRKSISVEIFN